MAVVTATWGAANPVAPQAIFNSWGVLAGLAASQKGRDSIRSLMRICDALDTPADVTNGVYNWLSNAVGFMTHERGQAPVRILIECLLLLCRSYP